MELLDSPAVPKHSRCRADSITVCWDVSGLCDGTCAVIVTGSHLSVLGAMEMGVCVFVGSVLVDKYHISQPIGSIRCQIYDVIKLYKEVSKQNCVTC